MKFAKKRMGGWGNEHVIILLFIRALRVFNFYNWHGVLEWDLKNKVVVWNMCKIDDFNIGQRFVITSVNRTTGLITGDWE